MLDVLIDHQQAILRQLLCKELKAVTDIIDVLKKVEVIGFDVQDDLDGREEAEKRVRVLTGLHDEGLLSTDADVSTDVLQHAADRNGRILMRLEQDLRDHRGRGRLSMGARDIDRLLIVPHDLTEELGPGQHREILLLCGSELRVIRVNRRRIDDDVDVICDVLCHLRIVDHRALRCQLVGQC